MCARNSLTPDEIKAVLLETRDLLRRTGRQRRFWGIIDADRLRSYLAEVHREGYEVIREEMTLESCSVIALVRDADERVVAALSVVAHNHGADLCRLVLSVFTAAHALSRDVAAHWARADSARRLGVHGRTVR